MKKIYEKPEIRIEEFRAEDIIRTSGAQPTTNLKVQSNYVELFFGK